MTRQHARDRHCQVRVIAGKWRSRKLGFPAEQGLRPTPDRVRETLFNWLRTEIIGSRCLDLYAGSGALGFEALSRGAAHVTMVDSNTRVADSLVENARVLQADALEVIVQDAAAYLQATGSGEYDLVFLDPPFHSGLLAQACRLLEQGRWLSNHAKIYIESDAGQVELEKTVPTSWHCLRSKRAGQVAFALYQRSA